MPVALITGITGQDGSYLTELLLGKGYVVHGMVRRSSDFNRSRIEHLRSDPEIYGKRLFLHYGDLRDSTTLRRILTRTRPDELYHFAGQSHPGLSFEIPESTIQETANATLSLLEIMRDLESPPRLYMAATSEVFGVPDSTPQNESTPFRPATPYGCAKAFAANLCRIYRETHKLHISCGIAYNHESPRRGESFVTRKITSSAARIAQGSEEVLELGNLSSERDWGYSPEYVEAMWRMLQQSAASDYVLSTGTLTSVRDFATTAFETVGMHLEYEGQYGHEVGRDSKSGRIVMKVNPTYYRPQDPQSLVGNYDKALRMLGWKPLITGTAVAVKMMAAEQVGNPTK